MQIGKYNINKKYTVSHIGKIKTKNKETGEIETTEGVLNDAWNSWLTWSLKVVMEIGNKSERELATKYYNELIEISSKYETGYMDERSLKFRIEENKFYDKYSKED